MSSADDVRMSDVPGPETLQTIAAKIDALSKSFDERFAKVDQRFEQIDQRFEKVDQQFAETRAQLGVKIEAVETR